MAKNPAFQFYPQDWLNDMNLKACSLEAQGLWISLIALMHQSQSYGTLLRDFEEKLPRLLGQDSRKLKRVIAELVTNGVARRDGEGRLYSKRMIEDEKNRKEWRGRKEKERSNDVTPVVTLKSRLSSSSSSSSRQKPPLPPKGFEEFWKAYPKKVGKGATLRSFKKGFDGYEFDSVLASLEIQKKSVQWRKNGGQFIPNPATWLNQQRWLDEVTVPAETRNDPNLDKKMQAVTATLLKTAERDLAMKKASNA